MGSPNLMSFCLLHFNKNRFEKGNKKMRNHITWCPFFCLSSISICISVLFHCKSSHTISYFILPAIHCYFNSLTPIINLNSSPQQISNSQLPSSVFFSKFVSNLIIKLDKTATMPYFSEEEQIQKHIMQVIAFRFESVFSFINKKNLIYCSLALIE